METISGGVIRILHVEDDPHFAELCEIYLQREDDNFEIVTANSVESARKKYDSLAIDCIVSDYDMPGKSGIDFLHAIRIDDPELPFILFTGKGSEEVASEAISAGVSDYLQKGGAEKYEILANRINNVVEGFRNKKDAERYLDLLERALSKTDTYVWEWNFETGEIFRYPSKDTLSKLESTDIGGVYDGFLERVHPDEREQIKELIEAGIANGSGYQFECRFEDKDGAWRWIRDHAEVQFEGGEPKRALGMVKDITELKAQYELADETGEMDQQEPSR